MPSLELRLMRLEQSAGGDPVPLYIRAWLGEVLTLEQRALADDELTQVRDQPAADPVTFDHETRTWLSARGMAA